MRALIFDFSIPRYVVSKALGGLIPSILWGRFSELHYRQIPDPPLLGDDWVRVATRLGGICGSDLHAIRLDTSLAATAFTTFPFVFGHEAVGTVVETGPAVRGLVAGQRVTVEPALPCATRGFNPPCPYCAAGDYNLCLRYTDGHLSPGLMIGFSRDTGGSWGENFVAHQSQVFPLPESVNDANALMVEPLATAVHPMLHYRPDDSATVLIIGGGVMGQCVVAALRALGSRARVVALVKYPFQEEMARRLGADRVIRLGRGDAHYQALADLTGGTLAQPKMGKRVLLGGADLTVECVGSSRSLEDALRLTRPGGTVLVLGQASVPRGVDWTAIWMKELHVTGSYIYGVENWQGRRQRTMEIVLDWMAEGRVDLSPLLTHLYPLKSYPQAFATAMGKAQTSAFKVAFHFPQTGSGREEAAPRG